MKTKILITGSGGFIGSNLTRFILKNYSEYSIVGIDRFDNPSLLNTIYSNRGYSFYIGDVNNSHFLHTIFELEKPEIVIHLAYSENDIFNFNGIQNLIKECKNNSSKLIYVSSYEVYNDSSNEDDCLISQNTNFGIYKNTIEKILSLNYDNYLILRPTKVFGPKQSNDLIPKLIHSSLIQNELIINDNISSTYSWIHVQDFCSALIKLIDKQQDIYNISTNNSIPNYEILKIIEDKISKLKVSFQGQNKTYKISNNKLLNEGWVPSWKFKAALEDTVDWYLKNKYFLSLK